MNDKNQPPTARDVLVDLLGEARADEVIETAARAEYAHVWGGREDWSREGVKYRELWLISAAAALAAVLPDLMTKSPPYELLLAECRESRDVADRIASLYQKSTREARAERDALRAERDALRAERDALAARIERARALHSPIKWAPTEAICDTCSVLAIPDVVEYPCDTLRALDGDGGRDDVVVT